MANKEYRILVENGLRQCVKCGLILPISVFLLIRKGTHYTKCVTCMEIERKEKITGKKIFKLPSKIQLKNKLTLNIIGYKLCNCCNELKPTSSFYSRRNTLDKLDCYCKTCTENYRKIQRFKNQPKRRNIYKIIE